MWNISQLCEKLMSPSSETKVCFLQNNLSGQMELLLACVHAYIQHKMKNAGWVNIRNRKL